MELPRVSIIVPVFNAADFIVETIESLVAQDYPNLEIIVVDDGSTDGSEELILTFADNVKSHRQANSGQSAALTAGWSMASGEFIGYLSGDDKLKSTAVRLCAEALIARPHVVLTYPDFETIDTQSIRRSTVRAPEFSRRALFAKLHCLPGPGALFRRSAYEKAGPWRSDFRQIPDLDFFLRLALEGDFYHLPQVLAEFRIHDKSATYRSVSFDRAEEPLRMIESFFSRSDLPEDIRSWEPSSRARANVLSAAIHGRSGRTSIAVHRFITALIYSPQVVLSRQALSAARLIAWHSLERQSDLLSTQALH